MPLLLRWGNKQLKDYLALEKKEKSGSLVKPLSPLASSSLQFQLCRQSVSAGVEVASIFLARLQ
jgi:hypothetical protein